MWNNLFGSVNLLQKGLNAAWMRDEVISNNIANADTVGFKPSEVQFENVMKSALGREQGKLEIAVTDEKHISVGAALPEEVEPVVTTTEASVRYDENGVDIESEMVDLAKNAISYYTMVSKVNAEFTQINSAINVT